MKLRYIPAALLFALVATCGYFAYTGPTLDNQWQGCPNVTWRVQIPVPVAPELQYRLEIDKAIAQIEKEIPLVTTARLPRDVHEAEVQQKPEGTHQMW